MSPFVIIRLLNGFFSSDLILFGLVQRPTSAAEFTVIATDG